MKFPQRKSALPIARVLPIATAVLAIGIFVIDTLTDLEIAVAVLYVAVILMSIGFCRKRGVILVSLGCMCLTILSYFLTQEGSLQAGAINCGISLLANAATTFLALRIESAEVIAQETRAQLAHIARVTALGELTASIAHEVNQPIAATVINGNTGLRWLTVAPPNIEEAKNAFRRIITDANRAAAVISRVRGLARMTPPQKELLDINKVVQETLTLTDKEIQNSHVALNLQLSDGLPPILGDRIQLQQVFLNLVLNAVEAMSDIDVPERELSISTTQDGSHGVRVIIQDRGHGLDPAKIDHLFEAFYTTKREGLGMGLAISRSIIESHGGRIWAGSNTPRGAVFRFILPTAETL